MKVAWKQTTSSFVDGKEKNFKGETVGEKEIVEPKER